MISIGRHRAYCLCRGGYVGNQPLTFLLLLSALFSALTGATGTVGRAVAPQAVTRGVVASDVAAATIDVRAQRPVQPLATLVRVAGDAGQTVFRLTPVAPLFAQRRRE